MHMITHQSNFDLYLQHRHQANTKPGLRGLMPKKTAQTEDISTIHMQNSLTLTWILYKRKNIMSCVILLYSCSCVHWLYIQQWCVIVHDLASFFSIHEWTCIQSADVWDLLYILLPTLLLSPFLFFSASHSFLFLFVLLYLSWGLRAHVRLLCLFL